MKYIIMCGGNYQQWESPRQLLEVNNEKIVERTIRLLRENGIEDIAISSNDSIFEGFGVPVLTHFNSFTVTKLRGAKGYWVDGFHKTDEPVCYLFGDVIYSPEAIKTIVETETDSVEFFASSPPFNQEYMKHHAEPFAFKVTDMKYFWDCVETVKVMADRNEFYRHPIAWELWQVIKNTPVNDIDYTNYTAINDYTCDIDAKDDLEKFNSLVDIAAKDEQWAKEHKKGFLYFLKKNLSTK